MKLGPYELNSIITGDARALADAVPDNSIDLIFTDPVYQNIDDYRWLAETAARVLKPGASVLAFTAHQRVVQAGAEFLPYLTPGPVLEHYITGPVGRLFSHQIQCNVLPCLWFSKGLPKSKWMALQQADYLDGGDRGHKWGKNERMIRYRLSKFTELNDIVFDPFTGGGTVPAVCKMLGRNYLAFEIDEATADKARQRVQMTQPPLMVLQPEQAVMSL